MKIGLIDVDSRHFPNFALMKLSAWHKAQGDAVEEEQEFLKPYIERAAQGQLLDTTEIEIAYEKAVGHHISSGQTYRVLWRHGWRKVMPRSRHPKKASEEVIAASKKLKKK